MDAAAAHGLGDEDALGQDLARGLQVGRREAEPPAPPLAGDDPAADLVGAPEQTGRFVDAAPHEQTPHGRRADDAAGPAGRRDDTDTKAGLPAQLLEQGDAAEAVPAEAEALADDDLASSEL